MATDLQVDGDYVIMLQIEDDGSYTLLGSDYSVLSVDGEIATDFGGEQYDFSTELVPGQSNS